MNWVLIEVEDNIRRQPRFRLTYEGVVTQSMDDKFILGTVVTKEEYMDELPPDVVEWVIGKCYTPFGKGE